MSLTVQGQPARAMSCAMASGDCVVTLAADEAMVLVAMPVDTSMRFKTDDANVLHWHIDAPSRSPGMKSDDVHRTAHISAGLRLEVAANGRMYEKDAEGKRSEWVATGLNWGKRRLPKHTNGTGGYYNSSDVAIMKSLFPEANHVRLVLDYMSDGLCRTDIFSEDAVDTGYIQPKWLAYIDDAVRWTEAAGVKITLTFRNNIGTASPHGGEKPGSVPCGADYIGNKTARSLWIGSWQFLARRFRGANNIAWYEPASEPHLTHYDTPPCHTKTAQRQLMTEFVAAIRSVDKDTPIAVTVDYGQCPGLSHEDKLADRQVIYVLNWFCANSTYNAPAECRALGGENAACLCPSNKSSTVQYNSVTLARLMAPALHFKRTFDVPLWIDQLGCAPGVNIGAGQWLHDSLALGLAKEGVHFDWWTWKGDALDDPQAMSVIREPGGEVNAAVSTLVRMALSAYLDAKAAVPTIRVAEGLLRGTLRGDVAEFKGIPFALPPTGAAGRFRPPRVPAASWTGVRDASQFQPNCLSDGFGRAPTAGIGDEDCLYLNVYAPARPSKPLPVLFWIYGGGFQGGGADETHLNGTWDVALSKGELIVVTSNYRVNIWGWLASDHLRTRDAEQNSTGNYGVQDQRAAMRWTSQNIAAFGGDPTRVFIVGQSAGSALVSIHLTNPRSWPFFSAAGLESGAYYTGPTVAGCEPQFAALLEYLHCPAATAGRSTAAVDCLVGKPTSQLFAAYEHFKNHHPSVGVGGTFGWRPSIDGVELVDFVPVLAYKAAHKVCETAQLTSLDCCPACPHF